MNSVVLVQCQFFFKISLLPSRRSLLNPNKLLQIPLARQIMSWSCSRCTFRNQSNKKTCEMCESLEVVAPSPSQHSSSSLSSPLKWSCEACTFLNPYNKSNCEICDTRFSRSLISNFEDLTDSTDNSSSAVGSVFFPLRRCTTKVTEHVNLVEDSIGEGKEDGPFNGFKKRDELAGVRGWSKAESFQGELEIMSNLITADAVENVKKSVNKRKRGDLAEFFEIKDDQLSSRQAGTCSEEERSFSGKGKSDVSARATKMLANDSFGIIKILTYNVWFREDLEMDKRMEAIGDLVDIHSPDIICFQEVTPDIFRIFERSSWWKRYRISPRDVYEGAYFCIQLAKLPVKSFLSHPFSNTIMGRELCMAEVEVRTGQSLLVATSHLESPCPAPPSWDQMFSKERVEQAKQALKVLQKYPNVIFCGDMNWDDKLDGQFPCPEGWIDAWARLKPGEIGYTYDTKSNKMLSGNRTLQKRLDRFICHLQDFKISTIEMIGMEEIPGLLYCKEKRVKGSVKKMMLPVLPSDHYGLLLTISGQ